MSPQEISDYKMKWKPNGFAIPFHSDLDWKAKDWCRKHLQRHQWSMDTYTDVYEHTMFFELKEHADEFNESCAAL